MPRARLDSLDNLRVALILLVVAHHAAQPYGPPDWWYFRGEARSGILATFSAVNGAFFMSLFFLLSAFLVPTSLDAKGAWPFVRGRLRRLGIPFVVGTLTIIPGLMYAYYVHYRGYPPLSFPLYYRDVFLGFGERPPDWSGPSWPDLQFGHLWFLQHLLVYSLLYLACRWLALRFRRPRDGRRVPGHVALVAFTLAVTAGTFAVRLRYPLDTWVALFGFLQAEPARMAQYVAFFSAGIAAARAGWFQRLPASTAYPWLALGLGLALLPFLAGGTGALGLEAGGATWGSLAGAAWENFLCMGLCVGLVVLFRERYAGGHALLRSLAASAYGVYILHVPIVVALQFALAPVGASPLLAFALVATIGAVFSFAAAEMLRRLPGFRSVL